MYAGIAGGESGNNRQLLKSFFSDFGFAGFDCGSDNNNILRAGLGDSDGISIIMGTGFCIFKSYNGTVSHIAGWGYFFDECGSAFNLGREALSAYFSELDGTGEKTLMSPLIEKADKGERETFVTRIYDAGKTFVASFAPCVFEAAGMGDRIAKNIIDRNISGVAEKIEKATADLLEKESKVKVVLAGGLTSQKNLPELISAKLTKPDRYDITILSAEPVIGAVNLSKKIYEENELCLKQK
jgi:N-acetylglucosamine kinase-like BadF-type ATPase